MPDDGLSDVDFSGDLGKRMAGVGQVNHQPEPVYGGRVVDQVLDSMIRDSSARQSGTTRGSI